ncbi:MAG: hypothetical protein WC464_02715 [Bdellovibrionales bacterium]
MSDFDQNRLNAVTSKAGNRNSRTFISSAESLAINSIFTMIVRTIAEGAAYAHKGNPGFSPIVVTMAALVMTSAALTYLQVKNENAILKEKADLEKQKNMIEGKEKKAAPKESLDLQETAATFLAILAGGFIGHEIACAMPPLTTSFNYPFGFPVPVLGATATASLQEAVRPTTASQGASTALPSLTK